MAITISGSGITSANIADGTIVNADLASGVGAGGLKSQQVFTASGTWTKPTGINTVKVYVTGGGGGGGGADNTWGDYQTCGAGAGGTAIEIIDVSAVSTVSVTIGNAGDKGSGHGVAGGSGGTSSFGTYCSATGGAGSDRQTPALGGVGTGGDINITGGAGVSNVSSPSNWFRGGKGGDSFFGAGSPRQGTNGIYGGGGCGSRAKNTGGTDCTDGGSGIVVVEEYS